eukprot:c19294_g2_i2.p1 GENE.c19294_g2_i2~~c19294_g2_i2.p1  ORF type:complete len:442 (-),score=86.08 c19294_g2_i2:125-1450(-)
MRGICQPQMLCQPKNVAMQFVSDRKFVAGTLPPPLPRSLPGACSRHLFVVSSTFANLTNILPLSRGTGGSVRLYQNMEGITLPQDIVKVLVTCGTQVLLRIRCSSEIAVAQPLEVLQQDPQTAGLFRIPVLHPHHAIAFDIFYPTAAEFHSAYPDVRPTIQVAIAYNRMFPNGKFVRMLRVCTFDMMLAESPSHVFSTVNIETVLALLTRKVLHVAWTSGVTEARARMFEWIVSVATKAHQHSGSNAKAITPDNPRILEDAFGTFVGLKALPRLVWGLLRHPAISLSSVHADDRAHLFNLLSILSNRDLRISVYPRLDTFMDSEGSPSSTWLPLTQATLEQSRCKLALLDNYATITLLYHDAADIPLPLPADSRLRTEMEAIKYNRLMTPRLIYTRPDESNARYFKAMLIEEGAADTKTFGYETFTSRVAADLHAALSKRN